MADVLSFGGNFTLSGVLSGANTIRVQYPDPNHAWDISAYDSLDLYVQLAGVTLLSGDNFANPLLISFFTSYQNILDDPASYAGVAGSPLIWVKAGYQAVVKNGSFPQPYLVNLLRPLGRYLRIGVEANDFVSAGLSHSQVVLALYGVGRVGV